MTTSATLENYTTLTDMTNHAADVLAEVDAKHRDIHPFLLLLIRRRAYDAGRRGGPFHKTSHAR